MIGKLIVLFALIAASSAVLRNCTHGGNQTPQPTNVNITACDVHSVERCKLIRGESVKGTFEFTSSE